MRDNIRVIRCFIVVLVSFVVLMGCGSGQAKEDPNYLVAIGDAVIALKSAEEREAAFYRDFPAKWAKHKDTAIAELKGHWIEQHMLYTSAIDSFTAMAPGPAYLKFHTTFYEAIKEADQKHVDRLASLDTPGADPFKLIEESKKNDGLSREKLRAAVQDVPEELRESLSQKLSDLKGFK